MESKSAVDAGEEASAWKESIMGLYLYGSTLTQVCAEKPPSFSHILSHYNNENCRFHETYSVTCRTMYVAIIV